MLDKILEIIKINIKVNLAYAINAWGAFFVTILQIFVFYYIWMAIYKFDSVINGISKGQIVTYIILSRIIYTQVTSGFIPRIGRKIHTGEITMDLLKPMDFQLFMLFGRIGDFVSFFTITRNASAFRFCYIDLFSIEPFYGNNHFILRRILDWASNILYKLQLGTANFSGGTGINVLRSADSTVVFPWMAQNNNKPFTVSTNELFPRVYLSWHCKRLTSIRSHRISVFMDSNFICFI